MNFLIDSSSIINFCNASALHFPLQIPDQSFFVSPMVLGECDINCGALIMEFCESGLLHLIEENTLPLENFLELMETSPLGDGEIECIALANLLNMGVCSDDRRARILATLHRGRENVVGSIRLLRWCVEAEIITCTNAFQIFQVMVDCGGFLPETQQDFFCLEAG